MEIFENLWGWFEDSEGWIKILVLGLMLALGAAGFFGWNAIKDFTNPSAAVTEQVGTIKEAGQKAVEEGQQTVEAGQQILEEKAAEFKETAEDAKQKALDYTQNLLNKFKN